MSGVIYNKELMYIVNNQLLGAAMVNVGRLQLEIGFRNCRTDIENSREVEFTEKS
jgi:hypothetical protein